MDIMLTVTVMDTDGNEIVESVSDEFPDAGWSEDTLPPALRIAVMDALAEMVEALGQS